MLVAELLDVAARYHADDDHADPAQARKALLVRHPLQPFTAAAFGAGDDAGGSDEPRRFSYRQAWHPAAASGRATRPQDMPSVRTITRTAAPDNYRFSSLVLGVVKTPQFQMRTKSSRESSGEQP